MSSVGELFRNREAHLYPSADEILARELGKARASYPHHAGQGELTDAHLLAFRASSLARAEAERTQERDRLMRPDAAWQRRMHLSWPVMAEMMGLTPEQAKAVSEMAEANRSSRAT